MKQVFLIITFLLFNQLLAQEKVNRKDLYYEGYLAYKISSDELFTGSAQKVRKNGHLVYEEIYENGTLIKSTVYYNRSENVPAEEKLYYYNTFTVKTKTSFSLENNIITYIHYDKNKKKTLKEIYTKNTLTYRCEYFNGKKHGIEFCLNEDGTKWEKKFNNGKKTSQQ